MSRPLLVADLFCGAGGSSTGARRALEGLGLSMKLVAVNHWAVAIATHQANHPEAAHLCVDVYKTSPREAIPGGRLDLLMASPTCTYFSRARGGKPISRDQLYGRMTPVQVLRWLRELDVRCLLVENVPEFVDWGPVCRVTGKPKAAKRGLHFRAWIRRIERLGYRVEHRVLNAADYGDATTRRRFFLLARKDGAELRWPEPSHSRTGADENPLFGTGAKRWRAAREVIDWSIEGKSIFNRKHPLSPKTIARIYAGAVRFRWPEPFLIVLRQHMAERCIDDPLPALTAGGTHVGLVQPFVLPQHQTNRARGVSEPVPVVTTTSRGMGLAEPLLVRSGMMHQSNALCVRDLGQPVPTITTDGGVAVVEPLVLPQGGGGAARPVDEPVATIATDGAHALIAPYYGQSGARPAGEPLPTVTCRDRFGLVTPVTHADASQRARSLEDPLPTVTAAHRGELAFVAAAFGERAGQAPRVHSVDDPAPTICATGRVQIVQGHEPTVDIRLRMLQPHELAAAMGFVDYAFQGTKEEVIRQIGNAVPVNLAAALVHALMAPARRRRVTA